MNNLFYIDYSELKNLKNTATPIGVIIRMDEIKLDEFNTFMMKIVNDTEGHSIEKVIIDLEFNFEVVNNLQISENIYYRFYNEDQKRAAISTLKEELRERIIGIHTCSTGVEILRYRAIGISNIVLASPFINDDVELQMLEKIGYTIFAVPNYNNNFGSQIDSNWIRPESIELYNCINNWILVSDKTKNIDTIISAYTQKQWIGKISDFLVNFDKSFNTYRNLNNLLSPTFDVRRTVCRGECLNCNKCEKEFIFSQKFTGQEE